MASLIESLEAKRRKAMAGAVEAGDTGRPKSDPPPRTVSSADILRQQANDASIDRSVRFIDLELIDVEKQVREHFDADYIQDLACDFALSPNYQPKKPVTVFERSNGRYLLDTGENRYRAMRFAQEHRREMQVDDVTAFTTIRATILGPEPGIAARTQSQVKENVLRDDLNMVELGKALLVYFQDNPAASQTDAATWCGFRNSSSGRVKVNTALKLMKCEPDLLDLVLRKELSAQRALEIQSARVDEAQQPDASAIGEEGSEGKQDTRGAAPGKVKPKKSEALRNAPKKQITVTVTLEKTLQLAHVLNWIAKEKGLEPITIGDAPGRKDAMSIINSQLFNDVLNIIETK